MILIAARLGDRGLRRPYPTMTGDNTPLSVDQHRGHESKSLDAFGELLELSITVDPRASWDRALAPKSPLSQRRLPDPSAPRHQRRFRLSVRLRFSSSAWSQFAARKCNVNQWMGPNKQEVNLTSPEAGVVAVTGSDHSSAAAQSVELTLGVVMRGGLLGGVRSGINRAWSNGCSQADSYHHAIGQCDGVLRWAWFGHNQTTLFGYRSPVRQHASHFCLGDWHSMVGFSNISHGLLDCHGMLLT